MILFRIIKESFSLAMSQLWSNKLRTFLSLLGISIGIFCIIAVLSAVDSLEKNIDFLSWGLMSFTLISNHGQKILVLIIGSILNDRILHLGITKPSRSAQISPSTQPIAFLQPPMPLNIRKIVLKEVSSWDRLLIMLISKELS